MHRSQERKLKAKQLTGKEKKFKLHDPGDGEINGSKADLIPFLQAIDFTTGQFAW